MSHRLVGTEGEWEEVVYLRSDAHGRFLGGGDI